MIDPRPNDRCREPVARANFFESARPPRRHVRGRASRLHLVKNGQSNETSTPVGCYEADQGNRGLGPPFFAGPFWEIIDAGPKVKQDG